MKKLLVNMPAGDYFGWAICGKNVITEMSKKADVGYVPDGFEHIMKDKVTERLLESIKTSPNGKPFNWLQDIDNGDMKCRQLNGDIRIGYMFYESEVYPKEQLEKLKGFSKIATGSTWNTQTLKAQGFDNVFTVCQGVDSDIFKPMERTLLKDKFVVFSGGKFEHRKAQDVVINAVNILQQKYKDIVLLTSWTNLFAEDDFMEDIKKYLNPARTIMLNICSNRDMAHYMAQSDIGVFPNRCEAGTNLVMMEYMSCGKPVVAHYATGQKDVLDPSYAFTYESDEQHLLDATVARLEYAYHAREQFKAKGELAREAMQGFTWAKTADAFLGAFDA